MKYAIYMDHLYGFTDRHYLNYLGEVIRGTNPIVSEYAKHLGFCPKITDLDRKEAATLFSMASAERKPG